MSEAATVSTVSTEPDQPRRCPGTNLDGTPCATSSELLIPDEDGVSWCFAHHPRKAMERKAAGVLGGRRSAVGRRRGLDPDRIGKLATPEDALRITAMLTVASATGELAAPQVNAALSAVKAWLAAYEADVLDKKLAAWEAAQGRP